MKKLTLPLYLSVVLLFGIGLVTLMSASAVFSSVLRKDQFAMSMSQLGWGAGVLFVTYFLASLDYRHLRMISVAGIVLCLILLLWTRFASPPLNRVHRWFFVGSTPLFQTADVAKLLLFIFIAAYMEKKGELIKNFKEGYLPLLGIVLLVAGLIVIQPSISNTILILVVSIGMFFVGGVRWQHLAATIAGMAGAMYVVIREVGYARDRWVHYVKGLTTGIYDDQVNQALIGLGSGGWVGRGIGNSEQRNLHLPEAYGDFIYAIAGEEFGFIGAVLLLLLYFMIFWMGLDIAKRAKDTFGQVLAFGISFSFLMHAVIHVAVSVGLLPNTGIPLLLVSHGKTSLVMTAFSIAILMSISIQTYKAENAQAVKEPA